MKLPLLFLLTFIPTAQAANAEFHLNGHINAALAAQAHDALAQGALVVRVNSSGGDDGPAMALAHDIRKFRASVIVEGLCAGPCASDIFAAAPQRNVTPGSLVIFSSTATSALTMVPPDKIATVGNQYLTNAAQEKALYNGIGIDAGLLTTPQLQMNTQCYSLTSRDPAGKSYINFRAAAIGWTPTRAQLAHLGVKVDGFWPQNPEQFQSALQKAFPGGMRGTVVFGGTLPKAPLPALKSVPQCPLR